MTNRQSFLDSMNAGRRRRPTTSLEELSNTLDALEQKLAQPATDRPAFRAEGPGRLRARTRRLADHTAHYDAAYDEARERPRGYDDRRERFEPRAAAQRPEADGIAHEINALRGELRQQMGSGLRREFAALKNEIDHAVRNSAPASHVAELGVEFERLAAMIHKMSQKSDDRQFNLLRLEMEEVKGALSKLAREETVRSFDHRWDEMNERWNDIASHLRSDDRRADASGSAIDGMNVRLEQIADIVKSLPTTTTLRALEADMKSLAATVEHIAHRQDRVGPDTMAAIEDRLDGLAHAVSASLATAQPAILDPEPFERLEERIALLARQIDSAAGSAPAAGMADQLAGLSRRVEDIAHRVDLPGDVIDRLAGQIDLISRKLDETPRAPDLEGVFTTFEDRFNALSGLLEQRQDDALAQGHALFRDLERRLEDVSDRIETAHAATQSAPSLLQVMDTRFAELTSRLDSHPAPAADDRAVRDLETRVEALSSRIDSSAAQPGIDPDLIRSLESQIAGLAARIAQPAQDAGALTPRLDKIEQSIADTRSDVIEAARKAAEEAVRTYSGAANAGDGLLVAGLVEDLKSLETLTRRSDDRNAKTFEAIHDTLLKIVDRLGAVESSAVTPPRAARLGARQTPSLAAEDDALPVDAESWDGPAQGHDRTTRSAAASAAAAAAQAATVADLPAAQAKAGDDTGKRKSMLAGLTRAFSGAKKGGERKDAAAVLPDLAPTTDETASAEAPAVEIDAPLDPQIANRPLEPGSGAPDLNAIMRRVRDERGIPGKGAEAEAAKSDFIAAARRAAQAAAAEAEVMKRAPAPKAKNGRGSVTSIFRNRRKPVLMGVAAVLIALAALQFGRPLLGGGETVADAPATPEPARVETAQPIAQADAPAVTENTARNIMALAPDAPEDTTTDWLEDDMPTAALPSAPVADADVDAADELAALPDGSVATPADESVDAIPLEAGPAALREAAAAGDPKALYEIGNRYADGRGVTADAAKAAEWYGRAAEEGLAVAQYRFANMNEKGNGVPRDIALARTWYERAAEQGNAGAMHNLAVLLAMGADGATDNETAAQWFARAAELGVTDSQFNLGILAAKGVGVPQNLEEAYKWFALVAKTGDRDAAEKRDEVAKALRPEQLEKTRADVELWRAKTPDAEANSVELPESWAEGDEVTASVDMRQAVRNIQHILNKNGYQAGSEDGMMGAKTKAAIAAFQTDNGMAATGDVDETLVRALLEKR